MEGGGANRIHDRAGRAGRSARALIAPVVLLGLSVILMVPFPAAALDPVNPVRVPVGSHPANSGFLVFVEGDVRLNNDESEGTIALGGDLTLARNYQIAANGTPGTFTAPGDSGPTTLYVGGGVLWDSPNPIQAYVQQGFTKILDTSTYSAFNRDNNNALVNYRIVPAGQPFTSSTFIDGRTNAQTPTSIGTPVQADLIDMPAAFARYRGLTQEMAACPTTVQLRDTSGNPLPQPVPAGAQGRLTLVPGQTNVLTLPAADLDSLAEITFLNQPSVTTPLLVNVTGSAFTGTTPNLAGIGGNQAPYILWNFPDMTSIVVTGGDSLAGTIYAPNADLVWAPSSNVQGNLITEEFTHGPLGGFGGTPREIHNLPFAAELSCDAPAPPAATLTLIKQVVNDNGGTALATDWTLTATGPTPITGTTGGPQITDAPVDPGDYTLTETGGPAGYTPTSWTCDGGTLQEATVTLAGGDNVTCTITNNDDAPAPPAATLTLIKQVVNDNGGTALATDWTLTATGPTPITGTTNQPQITDAPVDPGDYALTATDGPAGYTTSSWTCDSGTLQGTTVTLAGGADVTCIIISNDESATPPDDDENTTPPDDNGDEGGSGGDDENATPPGDEASGGGETVADVTNALPDTGGFSATWPPVALAALVLGGALLIWGSTGLRRQHVPGTTTP